VSGIRAEGKREEAKRWRFQQSAGFAATFAAVATIRAVLPALSARMKRKWERKRLLCGIRTLPAAVGTTAVVGTAAAVEMVAAVGMAAAGRMAAAVGMAAAVRTVAAVGTVAVGGMAAAVFKVMQH